MIAASVHSYLHAVVLVHKLFFALLDHISSVLGMWQWGTTRWVESTERYKRPNTMEGSHDRSSSCSQLQVHENRDEGFYRLSLLRQHNPLSLSQRQEPCQGTSTLSINMTYWRALYGARGQCSVLRVARPLLNFSERGLGTKAKVYRIGDILSLDKALYWVSEPDPQKKWKRVWEIGWGGSALCTQSADAILIDWWLHSCMHLLEMQTATR